LNPKGLKKLVLNKNGEWVETIVFDHQKDNLRVVKKIAEDVKEYKAE